MVEVIDLAALRDAFRGVPDEESTYAYTNRQAERHKAQTAARLGARTMAAVRWARRDDPGLSYTEATWRSQETWWKHAALWQDGHSHSDTEREAILRILAGCPEAPASIALEILDDGKPKKPRGEDLPPLREVKARQGKTLEWVDLGRGRLEAITVAIKVAL